MARIFRSFPRSLILTRKFRIVSTSVDTNITPTTGVLTITGFAPTVSTPRLVTPTTGQLTITGFAPTVRTPRLVTPTTAALTLTGFAPTVRTPRLVTPTTAALTLTGFAPTVATPVVVTPTTGQLILTGFAPTVSVSSATNTEVTPDAGQLILTGYEPAVRTTVTGEPDTRYLRGVPPLRTRRRPGMVDVAGVGFVAVIVDAALTGEAALQATVKIEPTIYAALIRDMLWPIAVWGGAILAGEVHLAAANALDYPETWARAIPDKSLHAQPLAVNSIAHGELTGECGLSSGLGQRSNGIAICAGERHVPVRPITIWANGTGTMQREHSAGGRLPVAAGAEAAVMSSDNEEQIALLLLGLPNEYGSLTRI